MRPLAHRATRFLLEIAGVAVGGVLVLAAIAIWRLSVAPFEAGFIQPYIDQAINGAHLGFSVAIKDVRLGWRRFRPVLDLHLHGVRVSGEGGAAVGAFEDATVGLSIRDLLSARLGVTEIDVRRPEIIVIRDAAGRFSLRLGQPDAVGATPDSTDWLSQFLAPPDRKGAIGELTRVRIIDGRVTVQDQMRHETWVAPDVDIDISRAAADVRARVDVALALDQRTARLDGEFYYLRADGGARLSLNIANFDAAAAAPLATVLSPLAALAVPVSGHIDALIDRSGHLIGGAASLRGGEGRFILPQYYPQSLRFRSVALDARFAHAPDRLTLDRMAIDFGDARVSAAGVADFDGPRAAIDARLAITSLPLARFDEIWPQGVAVGGRDWVTTHIPDGVIKSGTAHVAASGAIDDPSSFRVDTLDGAFDYTGLEVHYFSPMPPVRAIAGRATFDSRRMDLKIESGSLGDIAVSNGAIAITGFDQDERTIDIGLSLDGPLKTALSLLDVKPLGYAHDLGVAPETVGGRLNVRTTFAFPLIKALTFKQIALGAKGTLDGVNVARVVGPRDLTAGAMTIDLDKKSMTLAGVARLSGVPLTLSWRESFQPADRIRSRMTFRAELDDADRKALDLEPPEMASLRGPIAVSGGVTIDRARITTLDVTADLAAAEFSIRSLGLSKPRKQAGTANLSLVFAGDTLRRVSRLGIESSGLTVAGSAEFGADGAFRRAELTHVLDRRNDYAVNAAAEPGRPGVYSVSIKGARLDATPLLDDKTPAAPPSPMPRLDLTLAIDHVLTGRKTQLGSVAGTADLSGDRLDRADLSAVAGGPVTFTYTPAGDVIALHFAAVDAGAALAGLGLTRGVRGGTLRIDGTTNRNEGDRLMTGALDMRNFRLIDAPIIARLVNALSLTGFVDLLSGSGLEFDHLSSEIDYSDGKITLRNGRSAGALGISFEGDVDLDRNSLALKGTVVPVDTFNRILAAIPVVGGILTGGKRGGLIGLTYSVRGSPDDPRVSVNPLSMFAPGFLRNLFFLGPKEPEPTIEAPSPEMASPAAPPADVARPQKRS